MGRKLRIAAISAVLLFFLWVPLSFIAWGALGGVVTGFLVLAPLIAVQFLILKMLQRFAAQRADDGET